MAKTSIVDPNQLQVMLDLETLSTKKNAVIVSIGTTKFTLADGIKSTFSVNINPFDSKKYGLDICPETIAWWKKQPKETSDMWKIDPQPLKDAIEQFKEWYGTESIPIYGNSASFDCSILESSFTAVGLCVPWGFRDETCYRTICKLFPDVPIEYSGIAHSAVNDAISQTNHLLKLLG